MYQKSTALSRFGRLPWLGDEHAAPMLSLIYAFTNAMTVQLVKIERYVLFSPLSQACLRTCKNLLRTHRHDGLEPHMFDNIRVPPATALKDDPVPELIWHRYVADIYAKSIQPKNPGHPALITKKSQRAPAFYLCTSGSSQPALYCTPING